VIGETIELTSLKDECDRQAGKSPELKAKKNIFSAVVGSFMV
jgi:hypothetical protein